MYNLQTKDQQAITNFSHIKIIFYINIKSINSWEGEQERPHIDLVTSMGIWCILKMPDCTQTKTNACYGLINGGIFRSCGTDKFIEKAN